MEKTPEKDVSDIHALIQERTYDFYGFIQKYMGEIDDHVALCEACHKKMIGWTMHLPKLRVRMTVDFPPLAEFGSHSEWWEQMQQLKPGQCLPCGCEVTAVPWTHEEVSAAFYKALAEIIGVPEDKVARMPETTRPEDLPLTRTSLRQLRDKFWLPDGSYGSEKLREIEEEQNDEVRQLPETVGDFINKILRAHSGVSFRECPEHWSP